jgi:hypothetical protein
MSTFLFKDDPTYNGAHICPRCGSQSEWKAAYVQAQMITVRCEGSCGSYIMSYQQLSGYPHFREGQVSGDVAGDR